MSDHNTKLDEAIRNGKRLILLARLRLAASAIALALAALALIGTGERLHSQMGGKADAAYFLLSLFVLVAVGAWLRMRHGYRVFWLTFVAAALSVWAWESLSR